MVSICIVYMVICEDVGSVVSFCIVFGCFRIMYEIKDLIKSGIVFVF